MCLPNMKHSPITEIGTEQIICSRTGKMQGKHREFENKICLGTLTTNGSLFWLEFMYANLELHDDNISRGN